MNANLLNVLKQIVSQYRVAETLPRRVKNVFAACIEQGFPDLLQNVPPAQYEGYAVRRMKRV